MPQSALHKQRNVYYRKTFVARFEQIFGDTAQKQRTEAMHLVHWQAWQQQPLAAGCAKPPAAIGTTNLAYRAVEQDTATVQGLPGAFSMGLQICGLAHTGFWPRFCRQGKINGQEQWAGSMGKINGQDQLASYA